MIRTILTVRGVDEIWEIAPSRDGRLWLATYGAGLDKFDPETGKFAHYRHDPADAASLASDLDDIGL